MPRFLALDWDQNQLHLVAATVRGGKVKVERAAAWQETSTPPAGDAEALGRQLRDHLKTAGIAPAPLLVSLARDRVIVKDIRYPAVPEAEEPNVIRFQAVKELTDAADDVVIDYVPLTDRAAPEQRAMAIIVRKDIVQFYQTLCHAAGLKLAAVTPRPFGTAAAARRAMSAGGALTPLPEPADAAVALVTLSDKWAEFCVLRGESLTMARGLSVGPSLAGEIRRNVTVCNGQTPSRPVQAVYLSSGFDAALRQRLGELLDVPIYPFDPFAGAEVEVPGSPGGFAGAAGLLFARAAGRLPVNFVEPRKPAPPPSPYGPRMLVGAALLVMVFVALFITAQFVLAGKEREVNEAEQQKEASEKQAKSRQEEGKRDRALGDWELPAWLDELYDLTDRIPDVNQLRITSLTAAPAPHAAKTAPQYVGRLTIEGELLDDVRGREALNELVRRYKSDSESEYYLLEGPPVVKPGRPLSTFSFHVQIKKRPPSKYTRKLKVDP